jgi:hypothetical protein
MGSRPLPSSVSSTSPTRETTLRRRGAAAVGQLATSRGCLPRERMRMREARVEDVVGFIEQLREVA